MATLEEALSIRSALVPPSVASASPARMSRGTRGGDLSVRGAGFPPGAVVRIPGPGVALAGTRFVGEGVGGHLLRFATDRARGAGLGAIFACTTSTPVEKFFLRHGFSAVEPGALPASKWHDYPESRRTALRCLALEIQGGGVAGGGL